MVFLFTCWIATLLSSTLIASWIHKMSVYHCNHSFFFFFVDNSIVGGGRFELWTSPLEILGVTNWVTRLLAKFVRAFSADTYNLFIVSDITYLWHVSFTVEHYHCHWHLTICSLCFDQIASSPTPYIRFRRWSHEFKSPRFVWVVFVIPWFSQTCKWFIVLFFAQY